MSQWQCVVCGEKWPAWTTLDAFYKHRRAKEIHPTAICWQLGENPEEVTGIKKSER